MKPKSKQEQLYSYLTADFKTKLVIRDKESHFILIKGTIQQEEITIINIYALNVRIPDFI
jgi:hypothetical protein